eukprot:CAMPEP_0206151758 /NCGR_PEP_ID=MMETSP1473-20131121/38983_1 /ASSEMBLY_ACC=CAM_ASM_001109 /TAXON_ID=1461547 /ORGANISM="Stichococcus sp, Strain RCC1054" /LENGTH=44 /DNA_ID= /DNA_START= /DNA_END= /DNA_ORIENTATION=
MNRNTAHDGSGCVLQRKAGLGASDRPSLMSGSSEALCRLMQTTN